MTADATAPAPSATGRRLFEATGLTKDYEGGNVRALRGVDFSIDEGEFVAITGTSGSGKTTLLQLLGSLDTPTSGSLLYRGEALAGRRDPADFRAREIGFIFQSFHLLPTFTALENVQIPMFGTGCSARRRAERATELLDTVGLGHRLRHRPEELSGGEKQRVAIARSLANAPGVLLADEPTGNLDSENAAAIMAALLRVHRERGMALVLVTHDEGVAAHAGRIARMRDGRMLSNNDSAA